jgi:hypothetical protein
LMPPLLMPPLAFVAAAALVSSSAKHAPSDRAREGA